MAAQLEQEVGAVDDLVVNAGGYQGNVEEASPETIRTQFTVNLFGTVSALQTVLTDMPERREGNILSEASMGKLMTSPGARFCNTRTLAPGGIGKVLA